MHFIAANERETIKLRCDFFVWLHRGLKCADKTQRTNINLFSIK